MHRSARVGLTDGVYLTSLNPLESGCIVVLVVGWAGKGRPDGTVLEKKDKLGSKCSQTKNK